MEKISNLFTELIKAELCDKTPQLHKEDLTTESMLKLYNLSSKHDLAHLVGVALKKNNLLGEDQVSKAFQQQIKTAAFRHEAMSYTLKRIRYLFEEAEIVFVPLKGAVLSRYYPQDWMRTKSDLDILVREQDLKRAKNLLVNKLGYKVHKKNYHDIALVSPENTLLELHFRILEHEGNIDRVLDRVWDYVQPVAEGCFEHKMTNEFLMFHVYAHMYYHFIQGGCGLRFLVDIWLMEQNMDFNRDELQTMYKIGQLETFVAYVEQLNKVCFAEEEHDEVTLMMEEYIMTGGLFGSFASKVKARKTQERGKNRYMFKRVFMPYETMCASYPSLEKHPWRYPYYMVKRWLKLLNPETVDAAKQEIKLNHKMKQDSIDELKELFAILKGEKHV